MSRLILCGIVVCALGLSACGRKGPLERPPAAEDTAPEGTQKPNAEPEEKKSFLLDFLIQ